MAANLTISIAALALLLSTECQNAFDSDSDGNIHVAISTRGSNLDSDGYSLTVDGDLDYTVAAQGTLALQTSPRAPTPFSSAVSRRTVR